MKFRDTKGERVDEKTRRRYCIDAGDEVPIPPFLYGGEHIMVALQEIRFFERTMAGDMPLTFGAVMDYANATGDLPTPWERRTVVQMSQSYLQGRASGEDPGSYQPWDEFALDEDPRDGI